ncbi:MAG: efflux RND transporter periplasmic adaptor subunit [Proteobacteria bacterium]|nr:efflux RND transporter periplasmic adaptor subunit [Pseudomonadota bacterium]
MSTLLKPRVLIGAVVVIVLVAAAALYRNHGASKVISGSDTSPAQPMIQTGAALTVNLVRPVSVIWPETANASGSIKAWQEASVHAEISGARLTELLVDVGYRVEKGDLLARFDSAQANAALLQQRATLVDAQARLREAIANAVRAKELEAKNSLSEQDSIRAITTEQTARAQVDLARAQLESRRLMLENTRVIAPDAGIVSSRQAMLGMVAAPGMELFRLIRQNRLEWHAELIASALADVNAGNVAELLLPSGETVTGTVRQLGPVMDENTRTGIVYVALDDESHARIGMFASGTIKVGERAGLVLPSTAIVQRDGYEYVFVVDVESSRVAQRKVQTARRFANQIEVVAGVMVDDAVVETGAAFLSDGDRVRIVERPDGPHILGGV